MAIAKDKFLKWSELEAKRKELTRQASAIAKEVELLEEEFEKELTKSERQSIVRHGYTLAWVDGRATVKWKDEFIRELGSQRADELTKKAAEAAPKQLSITAPSV